MQSVYEMLTRIEAIQQQHSDRLNEVTSRLDRVVATQLRHGNRLDELAGQLDGVAGRLDKVAATQAAQSAVLNRIVTLLEQRETDGGAH